MQALSTQRGGTILGFILGVVVGLGIAFGVAVYVSKLPMPFLKGGDSARLPAGASARGDINAPLGGQSAPVAVPSAPTAPAAPATISPEPPPVATAPAAPAAPASGTAQTSPVTSPAVSADPLGDLAQAKLKAEQAKQAAQNTQASSSAGTNYFVQVGAFRNRNEAEAQRAKLAMLNLQARVSEREQNGMPMFRVRLGPFSERADAEQVQSNLRNAGMEASLVRVQP